MVMGSIDTVQVTKFRANLHVLVQQMQSRLRQYCAFVDPKPGDVMAYDRIGRVEARKVTGRFVPQIFDDIEFSRRALSREEFVVTLPVATFDVEGMLADPTGALANACMYAINRAFDRIIVAAMFANVNTGRNFETSISAVTDGVATVDMTSGVTFPKILSMDQGFIDSEADADGTKRKCMAITGEENTAVLQISQLTDNRFTKRMQIDGGYVKQLQDFDVVRFGGNITDPMLPVGVDGAGVRTSFAMLENAIAFGLWHDMEIEVQPRYDLVKTSQVTCNFTGGAVRTEGPLIQKVKYTV